MSHSKEKCNIINCPFCKSYNNHSDPICKFPGDVEQAYNNFSIISSCPWVRQYRNELLEKEFEERQK